VTWDDHEVCNDYGNDRDERLDPNFLQRRAAAYQAFYEHMPVRLPPLSAEPMQFANLRIYERYDWGRLGRLHVLDDRQYRSYQVCPKGGGGGSTSVTTAECSERLDPSRTMLGQEQEKWLAQGLAGSGARWNILTQQTLMAQSSQVAVLNEAEGKFWTDGWTAIPSPGNACLTTCKSTGRPIRGALRRCAYFYAANLKRDFYNKASAANPILATEFCGTSITSSFASAGAHRSVRGTESAYQIRPQRQARFHAAGYLAAADEYPLHGAGRCQSADSGISTLASFVVERWQTRRSDARLKLRRCGQ